MKNPIPPIIHLSVKDKALTGLSKFFLDQIKLQHPLWQIFIYDDENIDTFMHQHFPELIKDFYLFPHTIQRLDVFRMLVVYNFGGFYMDMDMLCMKSLNDLLQHKIIFAVEKTLTTTDMKLLRHTYAERIANYMFGSIAHHPFLLDFAKHALRNAGLPVNSENDILESTGPGLLTNFFHENSKHYQDIYLLRNDAHHCLKKCTHQPSCHFGHYAAHYHLGSWRWQ